MNQKKKTKILLIIIITLFIMILLVGSAFAYFATDIFKNDKELFFKYIGQISDSEKGFIGKELKNYFKKRSTVPFNNQGEFSVNISENGNEEKYKNVNNFNINFSGNVDEENKKVFQNIKLNYSDDVNFQLNYKQVGDKYGIQTNDVGSKFIAIDINNINKLSKSNMTINDYTTIAEKIQNISNVQLDQEQINSILDEFKNVLNEQLKPEFFSKVQDQSLEGYKLYLEGDNLKNITIKLLETLRNDQTTLGKINEYLKIQRNSNKLTSSDIDKFIDEIQKSSDFNNKKIEMVLYKKNGIVSKVSVGIEDITISIEKDSNKNSQSFEIYASYKNEQILKVIIKYDGLQSIQNVKENYEVEFNIENYISGETSNINIIDATKYKYNFINDINFTDSVEIEDFTEENTVILTNYNQESISNFLSALLQRLDAVNKRDMNKLGIASGINPALQAIPNIGMYSSYNASVMGNLNNQMTEVELNTFNSKFEMYQGTNLSSQTVKGLLSVISLNNENGDSYKIKEINFEGDEYEASEQNITFVKSDIDMTKNYRVEFEKDQDTGIIYRVIINAR